MTEPFTITAWDADGRGTTRIVGPLYPLMLNSGPENWSVLDDEILLTLSAAKMPWPEIAERLPDRTEKACRAHWYYITKKTQESAAKKSIRGPHSPPHSG